MVVLKVYFLQGSAAPFKLSERAPYLSVRHKPTQPTQPTKWKKNVNKIRNYRLGIVIVFRMRVCANGV